MLQKIRLLLLKWRHDCKDYYEDMDENKYSISTTIESDGPMPPGLEVKPLLYECRICNKLGFRLLFTHHGAE